MPAAGEMRDRYTFQARGGPQVVGGLDRPGDWAAGVTVWAKTQYLHGSEAVQQARLQGRQPVLLTIRVSAATRAIDTGWRAVDARDDSRVFDITGVEITPDRAFIQVLATTQRGQPNVG